MAPQPQNSLKTAELSSRLRFIRLTQIAMEVCYALVHCMSTSLMVGSSVKGLKQTLGVASTTVNSAQIWNFWSYFVIRIRNNFRKER